MQSQSGRKFRHSNRRADIGSILVARRAGTQHAIAAATETIETATATRTGFESEQMEPLHWLTVHEPNFVYWVEIHWAGRRIFLDHQGHSEQLFSSRLVGPARRSESAAISYPTGQPGC